MRVIAGKLRSRPLRSLRGLDIRPTSDRLRETLFNILTAGNPGGLAGSVWLDLFAGTGAVGIEALSRGAAKVYFVEVNKDVAELISTNLQSLGIATGFEILRQDFGRALETLERQSIRPDFVFLDPPYRQREAYGETLNLLGNSALSAQALIIVEHEKRFDPGEQIGAVARFRLLRQGDAALSFYRRSEG
ncbi:MAG: 16S rRNA (guanine(966)-N(2))-methyltransferase RsmD [Acidobacteria bacterium]|nr:MAG: 16S rRNA (guanine(966)-N(2))-methyltransferase RsmD [Acidobacteriota bacterium]